MVSRFRLKHVAIINAAFLRLGKTAGLTQWWGEILCMWGHVQARSEMSALFLGDMDTCCVKWCTLFIYMKTNLFHSFFRVKRRVYSTVWLPQDWNCLENLKKKRNCDWLSCTMYMAKPKISVVLPKNTPETLFESWRAVNCNFQFFLHSDLLVLCLTS